MIRTSSIQPALPLSLLFRNRDFHHFAPPRRFFWRHSSNLYSIEKKTTRSWRTKPHTVSLTN